MLVDMCLPKFDIYRSTVAPNCFNSLDAKVDIILKPINWFTTMATLALNELRATENLDVLISLKKNGTGQFVRALKKNYIQVWMAEQSLD